MRESLISSEQQEKAMFSFRKAGSEKVDLRAFTHGLHVKSRYPTKKVKHCRSVYMFESSGKHFSDWHYSGGLNVKIAPNFIF